MAAKTLRIYTAIDDPTKRLKAATQILLTLTPIDQTKLFDSETPIAWQVITFAPHCDVVEEVNWNPGLGFSSVSINEDGIVAPGVSTAVQVNKMAPLEYIAGTFKWTNHHDLNRLGEVVVAKNVSGVPKTLALCSIDEKAMRFDPVVHFKSAQHGKDVITSPPVMLQAYATSGYKKGQLLRLDTKDDFIFANWRRQAQPFNIAKPQQDVTWLLYSENSGKVILEQVE